MRDLNKFWTHNFQSNSSTDGWGTSCDCHWTSPMISQTWFNVMAWCRRASSHYRSQCWLRPLSPYSVTRSQWVPLCRNMASVILINIGSGNNLSIFYCCVWLGGRCAASQSDVSFEKSVLTNMDFGMAISHDDVIKWKHFPRYWLFLRGIHRSPVPTQRPVTRSDVFFDLRLNKRLSNQSWGWWFETPSCPLWRHRNVGNL